MTEYNKFIGYDEFGNEIVENYKPIKRRGRGRRATTANINKDAIIKTINYGSLTFYYTTDFTFTPYQESSIKSRAGGAKIYAGSFDKNRLVYVIEKKWKSCKKNSMVFEVLR